MDVGRAGYARWQIRRPVCQPGHFKGKRDPRGDTLGIRGEVANTFLQKTLLWVADLTKNEIGPKMDWIKVIDKYESDFHM